MKLMAVILFGLTALTAASQTLAQNRGEMARHGPSDYGHGPSDYRRGGPDYHRGGGPIGAPMDAGSPPLGPRSRPGPDSLGADWGRQQNEAFAGVRERRYVPLGRAIDEIRRRTPGGQLDAGIEQWGGRPAYRIRWATPNGRRIDYMVDAETGAILGPDDR